MIVALAEARKGGGGEQDSAYGALRHSLSCQEPVASNRLPV